MQAILPLTVVPFSIPSSVVQPANAEIVTENEQTANSEIRLLSLIVFL